MSDNMAMYSMTLTGRELAILGVAMSRLNGWDDTASLERFVNICADEVRDGWTEQEMTDLHEHLAAVALGEDQPNYLHRALSLAKEATNGWACYAKRQAEHDNIAHLHREIAAVEQDATKRRDVQDHPCAHTGSKGEH